MLNIYFFTPYAFYAFLHFQITHKYIKILTLVMGGSVPFNKKTLIRSYVIHRT